MYDFLAFIASSFRVTEEDWLSETDLCCPRSFFWMFSLLFKELIFIIYLCYFDHFWIYISLCIDCLSETKHYSMFSLFCVHCKFNQGHWRELFISSPVPKAHRWAYSIPMLWSSGVRRRRCRRCCRPPFSNIFSSETALPINQSQILCEASLGRGNKSFLNGPGHMT